MVYAVHVENLKTIRLDLVENRLHGELISQLHLQRTPLTRTRCDRARESGESVMDLCEQPSILKQACLTFALASKPRTGKQVFT